MFFKETGKWISLINRSIVQFSLFSALGKNLMEKNRLNKIEIAKQINQLEKTLRMDVMCQLSEQSCCKFF